MKTVSATAFKIHHQHFLPRLTCYWRDDPLSRITDHTCSWTFFVPCCDPPKLLLLACVALFSDMACPWRCLWTAESHLDLLWYYHFFGTSYWMPIELWFACTMLDTLQWNSSLSLFLRDFYSGPFLWSFCL
jgi:hypothetical protein